MPENDRHATKTREELIHELVAKEQALAMYREVEARRASGGTGGDVVELTGLKGLLTARVQGRHVVVLSIIVGVIALTALALHLAFGVSLWPSLGSADATITQQIAERLRESPREHAEILRATEANTAAVRDLTSEARIQSWLMSIPPDNRPRLVMPEGLERRLAPSTRANR